MMREIHQVFRREAGALPPDRPAVGDVEVELGVTDQDGDTPVAVRVTLANPTADPFEEVVVDVYALDEEGFPFEHLVERGGPLPARGRHTVEFESYFMHVPHERIHGFDVRARVVALERIGVAIAFVDGVADGLIDRAEED